MRTTSLSILLTILLLHIGIGKACCATNDNEKITISGTIENEDERPIIGGIVKLSSGNVLESTQSDLRGHFSISIVPKLSMCNIVVSHTGYQTATAFFLFSSLKNSKGSVKVTMIRDNSNINKNSSIATMDFPSGVNSLESLFCFGYNNTMGNAVSLAESDVKPATQTTTPASSSSYDFSFKNPTVPSSSTSTVSTNTPEKNNYTNAASVTTKSNPPTTKQTKNFPRQKRIALIIGNGDYANGPLMNPVNDAKDMRAKLQQLGFEVMGTTNVESKGKMREQVRNFCSKAKNYDAALFFYSGHARQDNGVNYLIPTRCDIKSEADVEDQCMAMNWIVKSIQDTGAKNVIVLLDACRNSPPIASLTRDSGYSGLADMSAMNGTIIGYSTRPGMVASDGRGQRNSPYTAALLKTLDIPGLPHHEFFQRVRKLVAEATGRQQIPTENMLLIDDFIFNMNQ